MKWAKHQEKEMQIEDAKEDLAELFCRRKHD